MFNIPNGSKKLGITKLGKMHLFRLSKVAGLSVIRKVTVSFFLGGEGGSGARGSLR
jgi:hypothetical protein